MKTDIPVSRISVPVNPAFIRPITAYVMELAEHMGFDETEMSHIHLALEESLVNVMKFGYAEDSEDTLELIFESQPTRIVIRIKEKGAPFNAERLPEYQVDQPDLDPSGAGLGLHLIKTCMDEVAFIRKGREGQEIRLTKHLQNKRVSHLLPALRKKDGQEIAAVPDTADRSINYTIRPLCPDEVVEVSKCAYQCYGYGYEDYVYFPERLAEMNEDGSLYSLVAVTEDNHLMGHAALKFPYADAPVAEAGVAFVYPQYRRIGLFSEFNEEIIERAKQIRLSGLYGRAVTSHTASQRMAAGCGYKVCGLFMGIFSDKLEFRDIAEETQQRESGVLSFLALNAGESTRIYLTEEYAELAASIFLSLGVPVDFSPDLSKDLSTAKKSFTGPFSVEIIRNSALNAAEIIVHEYGEYVFDEIRSHVRALCLERVDVIHVVLNLEDPGTCHIVDQAKRLGFVFGGILPYGLDGRHALILQYLNNVKIDFDRLKLIGPEAARILEVIKEHWVW